MLKRMPWIGLLAVLGLTLAATNEGWAQCDTCQVCKYRSRITIPADYCSPAVSEDGNLCCMETSLPAGGSLCTAYSSACYGIEVTGGGGGGGGTAGGAGCTYQGGWCPAECMSCSGGGRPAI